jgi:hypothetical protein
MNQMQIQQKSDEQYTQIDRDRESKTMKRTCTMSVFKCHKLIIIYVNVLTPKTNFSLSHTTMYIYVYMEIYIYTKQTIFNQCSYKIL